MSEFFYRPQSAWVADFIPFYKDGVFHLFYLHDWRDKENHGEGTPWYKITTSDFVHFEEHGEMLSRGSVEEQDLYVFTGCIIESIGKYHIFYTGHNPHLREKGLPEQGVMHAISDDLITWEKIPEDTFFAPDVNYEPHDWRDPFVFWNEEAQEYWMLLAARLIDSPEIRKGCTALCASKDLKHWEVRAPLWAPDMFFTHECPDLFKIGDWWYLIYSEFTDRCITRYRMSKSLEGPWISPENDSFDGRAYYAAKTAFDGKKRYIFGWNPTKEKNSDSEGWQWGGNLVVHEVFQKEDFSLGSRIPNQVRDAFNKPISISKKSDGDDISLIKISACDNVKTYVLQDLLPDKFKLEVSIKIKEHTKRCGIMLNANAERDNAYCYFLEPSKKKMLFDFWPNHPWGRYNTRECDQLVDIDSSSWHKITILVDNTICVAYLDDKVALSGRMYQNAGGKAGLIVIDGEAEFKDLQISMLS